MIDVNTTSKNPTYFLAAVELIKQAREEFSVCSENWPYPVGSSLGDSRDWYYAEIWCDGMDWQNNYWLLESFKYNSPQTFPLIIFEDHKNKDNFNDYDFYNLLRHLLLKRRNILWVKDSEFMGLQDIYTCLYQEGNIPNKQNMNLFAYSHASQTKVRFWLNNELCGIQYGFNNLGIKEK